MALLELARLFAKLYASSRSHARCVIPFLSLLQVIADDHTGWWSGVVVSALALINEVNLCGPGYY